MTTDDKGFKFKLIQKPGQFADKMCFPTDEIERLRITAIMRRETLIRDWLSPQSNENLIALLKEDANTYGFFVAHHESYNVQEAVLRAGMMNTPETIWLLTSSEHETIRTAALELWDFYLKEYPAVVAEFIPQTLRI